MYHFSCLKSSRKIPPDLPSLKEGDRGFPFGNLFPVLDRQKGMKGDFMMILLIY
jgi:hypothetical protein